MTSYTLTPYSEDKNGYQMIKKTHNTNNARIGLQYYLTDNDIISLNIDDYEFNKDDCGWINILKKNIVCCNMLKYIEKIEHCNY